MPAPVSRTVRLNLDLLARLEDLRERIAKRSGVEVDLRAVVERAVEDGIVAAERRLRAKETRDAAA